MLIICSDKTEKNETVIIEFDLNSTLIDDT